MGANLDLAKVAVWVETGGRLLRVGKAAFDDFRKFADESVVEKDDAVLAELREKWADRKAQAEADAK